MPQTRPPPTMTTTTTTLPDGDEAERKQRGINNEKAGQRWTKRWRHFHSVSLVVCCLHKNNEKRCKLGQSGVEMWKSQARRDDFKQGKGVPCYHSQLNASTLGRPRKNSKKENKKKKTKTKQKRWVKSLEQRKKKPNSITNWTVSSSCRGSIGGGVWGEEIPAYGISSSSISKCRGI